jgi:hypothetical protein
MYISIPFLAGIGKPILYFIFEYFITIYISLEKNCLWGNENPADCIKQLYH